MVGKGRGAGRGKMTVKENSLPQDATALHERPVLPMGPLPTPNRRLEARTVTSTLDLAEVSVELRRRVHRLVIEYLDLAKMDRTKMDTERLRPHVLEALWSICSDLKSEFDDRVDKRSFIAEMSNEILGLGPLEELLADPSVSEIMVVDPSTIYCERNGVLELTDLRFTDSDLARAILERIVSPLGRRIDESNPYVDARLPDGSRVNAIIPPLALRGPCITIRKFAKTPLTRFELVKFGTFTDRIWQFLERTVRCKRNVLISGGTGSGKTTLLNILSTAIGSTERVVTIEDAAELRLEQPHVVSLETRPSNMEGKGEVTIRDLVRNALRMRPDRIVVGECRGGEALDMLQAMNTGHAGSMTTTHANTPREALSRLETLVLMSGLDLPAQAIREQIGSSIDLVVQQSRMEDGTRRVTSIAEVIGIEPDGGFDVREIFVFERRGFDEQGRIRGEFRTTGYLPSYLSEFEKFGLVTNGDFL